MVFHPYARWNTPEPDSTPSSSSGGFLPSIPAGIPEQSARLHAHLYGVPYSSTAGRSTDRPSPRSDLSSSPASSNSPLLPLSKTLTINDQKSQCFTFTPMKPNSLIDCLITDGFNRTVLQVKTDSSLVGGNNSANARTIVSSEREMLASIDWVSRPPRVSLKGYGTMSVSDWIVWTEVPLMMEKWRLGRYVFCSRFP